MIMPRLGLKSPIGLDIGQHTLRAVQLSGPKGRRVVCAAASIGRKKVGESVDQSELSRLARVLSQQGFSGGRVVLAAPSERMLTAVMDVPPADSGAPYDLIVAQEFSRLHNAAPGSFESDWWLVPRPARVSKDQVMAVGCLHADTEPLLDEMLACRFDVEAVDIGFGALVRACSDQLGADQALSAVLDIGWHSARLALVYQSKIVFDRTFTGLGVSGLQQRVCESLRVQPEEGQCLIESVGLGDSESSQQDKRALAVAPLLGPLIAGFLDDIAKELSTSFEYASHQYPDATEHCVVLVGGGGAIAGAQAYLDTRVDATVQCARAGAILDKGANHSPSFNPVLMAAATGLAGIHD